MWAHLLILLKLTTNQTINLTKHFWDFVWSAKAPWFWDGSAWNLPHTSINMVRVHVIFCQVTFGPVWILVKSQTDRHTESDA